MFIKLGLYPADTYFNVDRIAQFYIAARNKKTVVCYSNSDETFEVDETPEQILALIEAEKKKELRDEFAKGEGLYDLANCNYYQEVMEALAGYPEPADLIESVEWESAWRAKLRYIRADAMLKAREA
jgi:hypothetical protein